MELEFGEELRKIIEKYKEGSGEFDVLDGDEVDRLIEHLRSQINLIEGNVTEEEYLKLEN